MPPLSVVEIAASLYSTYSKYRNTHEGTDLPKHLLDLSPEKRDRFVAMAQEMQSLVQRGLMRRLVRSRT